jgi:hypothetical protein
MALEKLTAAIVFAPGKPVLAMERKGTFLTTDR